jgi:carboxymethylenebutenolidase
MQPTTKLDSRVLSLYDDYCHGRIDRREFLRRAAAITLIGGASAAALAQAMLPRYALAQTISFTDERIKATYVSYPSPGGNSGTMRGYLVQPAGEGKFPAVVVFHENRGLNPYVEDVARRVAVAGFLALAPDSARFVKAHALSTGKLGAVGFCWGGGMVNHLAVALGAELGAGVPFYGSGVDAADVPKIKAQLLIQSAANDERINAMWPDFEAALKANGVRYTRQLYENTSHGFHNNSTPRYDEAAAKLAWDRTIAFFDEHLERA